MAKAIIQISDNEDGSIHLEANFDPEIDFENAEQNPEDLSPAQAYALVALNAVMMVASPGEVPGEDPPVN